MIWDSLKHHFDGDSQNLIEIVFEPVALAAWADLFLWMESRIVRVMSQYGYEASRGISLELFLADEYGYLVTLRELEGVQLCLLIMEKNSLEISLALEEIQSAAELHALLAQVKEIAQVLGNPHYYICPEFHHDKPFIINGEPVL